MDKGYKKRQNALWGFAGTQYQQLVALLFSLELYEKNARFDLAIELDEAGNLDDVVIRSDEIKYIQVKHHYPGTHGSKYTFAALKNADHKKRVSLDAFFESWRVLKKQYPDVKKRYYLFTNHELAENMKACLNQKEKRFSDDFIEGKNLKNPQLDKRKELFGFLQEKCNASEQEIKSFLYEFSFDFNQLGREDLIEKIKQKIRQILKVDDDHAYGLFSEIIQRVFFSDEFLNFSSIQKIIIEIQYVRALNSLKSYSAIYLERKIRTDIQGVHVPRRQFLNQLKQAKSKEIIVVHGKSGVGKSACLKIHLSAVKTPYLYLDTQDIRESETEQALLSHLTNADLNNQKIEGISPEWVVFDRFHHVNTPCISHFIKNVNARIVLIAETRYLPMIENCAMDQFGRAIDSVISITPFSEEEINEYFPLISPHITPRLKEWLTPFSVRMLNYENVPDKLEGWGPEKFAHYVIKHYLQKITGKKYPSCLELIKKIARGNPIKEGKNTLLELLVFNEVLFKEENGRFSFSHDEFLRWAIYEILKESFNCHQDNMEQFWKDCLKYSKFKEYFFCKYISFSDFLIENKNSLFLRKGSKIYLQSSIVDAIIHDNRVYLQWYHEKLNKIQPVIYLSNYDKTDIFQLMIESNAERCLDYMLSQTHYRLIKASATVLFSVEKDEPIDFFDEQENESAASETLPFSVEKDEPIDFFDEQDDESAASESEEDASSDDEDKYDSDSIRKYRYNEIRADLAIENDASYMEGFRLSKQWRFERLTENSFDSLLDCADFYIHYAISLENNSVASKLIEHNRKFGDDFLFVRNKYNETILHKAALVGDAALIRAILEYLQPGNNYVNFCDKDLETALHNAVYQSTFSIAELLLSNKADPNVQNVGGFTPLHLAVLKKERALVALLILHGARTDIPDTKNNTVTDLIYHEIPDYVDFSQIYRDSFKSATLEEIEKFIFKDNDGEERYIDEQDICWVILLCCHSDKKLILNIYATFFYRKFSPCLFKMDPKQSQLSWNLSIKPKTTFNSPDFFPLAYKPSSHVVDGFFSARTESTKRKKIETLGDGNCLFNAFAMGLCDLIQQNKLSELPPEFISLINESTDLPFSDFASFKDWILDDTDRPTQQTLLSPLLRKLAISHIESHYDYYSARYEDELRDVFNSHQDEGFEDANYFLKHPCIAQKISEAELTEEDFITWWHTTGKINYFDILKQPAENADDEKRWGAGIELDALAQCFNINVEYKTSHYQNDFGILGGIVPVLNHAEDSADGFNLEEVAILKELGFGQENHGVFQLYMDITKKLAIYDQPLSETDTQILTQLINNHILIFPQYISGLSRSEYQQFFAVLKQRGIITFNEATSEWKFITDGPHVIARERIERRCLGIHPVLKEKLLQIAQRVIPQFKVKKLANHWEYVHLQIEDMPELSSESEAVLLDEPSPMRSTN